MWVVPHIDAPDDFLAAVEEAASLAPSEKAKVGNNFEGASDPNIRVSSLKFLEPYANPDIERYVFNMVSTVNAEFFGFDLAMVQNLQHTTYRKGAFYKTHVDVYWETGEETPVYDRKLSISIQLNDPSQFEGGDLIINNQVVKLRKGQIVVFPSYVPHEVTKVTKGIRKSLVAWIWGSRWR